MLSKNKIKYIRSLELKKNRKEEKVFVAEGHKLVRPAYYESALRYKYMMDPESWEMMDIIIDHIYIDAGIIYTGALSSFHDEFRQIMTRKNNTVTSSYKSKAKSAKRSLSKMTDKLDALVERDT